MGKAARRMTKKKQQKIREDTVKSLQKQLREYFAAENYAEVVNTLALLVQEKSYDPEDLYKGAYSYFMTGDYPRAINMVNNVLNFAPAHLEARILLARICMLQEREQDGLAIFDFILEHYGRGLTAQQRQDMEEILEFYDRTEREQLAAKFPHIAQFFREAGGKQS